MYSRTINYFELTFLQLSVPYEIFMTKLSLEVCIFIKNRKTIFKIIVLKFE